MCVGVCERSGFKYRKRQNKEQRQDKLSQKLAEKLRSGQMLESLRTWTSSSLRGSPLNSGKFLRMSTVRILSTSRSVLLRKRMMDTLRKSLLLTMVSKMFILSTKRFVLRSSIKTWNHPHTHTHTIILWFFSGFICAPIKDSVVIIWLLIWTAATTEGTIEFQGPTTKTALCDPQMLCLSDVSRLLGNLKKSGEEWSHCLTKTSTSALRDQKCALTVPDRTRTTKPWRVSMWSRRSTETTSASGTSARPHPPSWRESSWWQSRAPRCL